MPAPLLLGPVSPPRVTVTGGVVPGALPGGRKAGSSHPKQGFAAGAEAGWVCGGARLNLAERC